MAQKTQKEKNKIRKLTLISSEYGASTPEPTEMSQ